VQDVDRPHDVEAFSRPAGAQTPRGEAHASCVVLRAQITDCIGRDSRRCGHFKQRSSIGPAEDDPSIRRARDPGSALVHGPMVAHRSARFESVVGPPCVQWRT
jgi:hypothetical protein